MTDELFNKASALKYAISNIEYTLSDYDKVSLAELIKAFLPKEEQEEIRTNIKARLELKLADLQTQFEEL